MKRWTYLFVIASVTFLAETAYAATSGDPMPWDRGLLSILSNIKGIVAPTLVAFGIFGVAFSGMMSEHGMASGVIRLIMAGSVALAISGFMLAIFGWSGATF